LFGKLTSGGRVVVDYQGEGDDPKVVLEFPEGTAPPPPAAETVESVV
jgi:hypothetical protein